MIVFPILNFVLPLMLSSFLLVGNPQYGCTECDNKVEGVLMSKSKKIETIELKKADIKVDLTNSMYSGDGLLRIPLVKE